MQDILSRLVVDFTAGMVIFAPIAGDTIFFCYGGVH